MASHAVEVLKPGDQLSAAEVQDLGLKQLAESDVSAAEATVLGVEFVTVADCKRRRLRMAHAPGILHPYFLPNRKLNGLRCVRYLRGYEPPDPQRPGKVMRYGYPKDSSPELYLPPTRDWERVFTDPTQDLWFVEGWLKALILCKHFDINALAYGGIWNYAIGGVLLPIYNEIVWRGRIVHFLNDKDVATNASSLQAENRHARLLTERCVEQICIHRFPENSKYGKPDDAIVGKGAQWLDTHVLKPYTPWDPSREEDVVPMGLAEEPVRAPLVIPPMPAEAMYGLAAVLTKDFDAPPSLTYPAVLALLSACNLPTTGDTRTGLYVLLLDRPGGCKTVITHQRGKPLVQAHTRLVADPVSDRGLINMLQFPTTTTVGEGKKTVVVTVPSVLMLVDEFKGVLGKANIENSTLYSKLNELWTETVIGANDRKGLSESSPCRFSLLGNLPCTNATQFNALFGSESQYGFYRRLLFGVGVREERFVFHPGVNEKMATRLADFKPSALSVSAAWYTRAQQWVDAAVDDVQRERRSNLYEPLLRVALVTASANGDSTVTKEGFAAALAFIEWQERIRTLYAPAAARHPYAQCMDMVLTFLDKCTGLVNWRRASQNHDWHKREFSQHLKAVKQFLISEGILVPAPGQKGLFYYRREPVVAQ
jgi:hypothetical protein